MFTISCIFIHLLRVYNPKNPWTHLNPMEQQGTKRAERSPQWNIMLGITTLKLKEQQKNECSPRLNIRSKKAGYCLHCECHCKAWEEEPAYFPWSYTDFINLGYNNTLMILALTFHASTKLQTNKFPKLLFSQIRKITRQHIFTIASSNFEEFEPRYIWFVYLTIDYPISNATIAQITKFRAFVQAKTQHVFKEETELILDQTDILFQTGINFKAGF